MMSSVWLRAAVATEATKFVRARVPLTTTVLLTAGIAVLVSTMLFAVHGSDANIAAKLGALVEPGGWVGYLSTASQITAVAGLLGFGVVLSWLYGREFSDRAVTGLFALPVSRATIAGAKSVIYLGWAVLVSMALTLLLLPLGLAFGLGPVPDAAWPGFVVQFGVSMLTALIALPAGWAATLGRGLLTGIAATIGIVVAAQVAVIGGVGSWFPFAAPGLWAATADVSAAQLCLVGLVPLIFVTATLVTWRRLQLDR